MRLRSVGKRARVLSVLLVLVTAVAGVVSSFAGSRFVTSSTAGSLESAVTKKTPDFVGNPAIGAAALDDRLRGVPLPGGRENEAAEIRERQRRLLDRLSYPAGRIPPAWRSQALDHIQVNVADARDLPLDGSTDVGPSDGTNPDAIIPVGANSWTSVGPAPIDNNAASDGFKYGLVTGRINAIAVDPRTTTPGSIRVWAGSAAGGLWKTEKCCTDLTTWTPMWDGKNAVSQAVGAIKLHPTNPDIVYVGTGDPNGNGGDQFGEGIMKTTNRGATWQQLGADVFTPYAVGTPDAESQNVSAIEIDPRRPNTVIVGTLNGFFMSYDAGVTWTKYNIANIPTNAAGDDYRQRISSIVVDGSVNPSRMFVAVGYENGGNEQWNGVYRASIPASGAPAFTRMTAGWPAPNTDYVGRIRLATSRGNPGKTLTIYAQVGSTNYNQDAYGNSTTALGTWVLRNAGTNTTWVRLAGSQASAYKNCLNQVNTESQDWYDLFIGVDPSNDRTLYVGRTSMYKATVNTGYSGFAGVKDLTAVYALSNSGTALCPEYGKVHPDNHAFAWVGPATSKSFLVGNDGGVYFNNNNGDKAAWKPIYKNMNITEFYAGQLGNDFTVAPQWAFGGSQDNGNESWDATGANKLWKARGNGGDGFFTAFDPKAGTLTAGNWYTEYTYGQLGCSNTGANGPFNVNCIGGWYNPTTGQQVDPTDWSTPYQLDQAHCNNTSCKNLILGTYRVWATGTGGMSPSAWKAVSGDLTQSERGVLIDVRYARSNPKAAVVGSNDGVVSVSHNIYGGTGCTQAKNNTVGFACAPNAAATWAKLAGGILPNRAIESVAFAPTTDKTIYAAVGGFNTNTPSTPGHIFQATCATNCGSAASWTWVNKSGNLPDVPATAVIANPNNAKQVFLGTYFGFYYTNDITAANVVWYRYQVGLPNTVIRYLTTDRVGKTLGAFTFGRSLYTIKLPLAAGWNGCADAYEPDNTKAAAQVFKVGSVQQRAFCANADQDWVVFKVPASASYRIETLNLSASANTILTLYSGNGTTVLKTDDDSGGLRRSLIVRTLAAGTYYVKAVQKGGAGAPTGYTYDLKIAPGSGGSTGNPCTLDEPNNTSGTAKVFTPLGSTRGYAFCASLDEDWIKFTVAAGNYQVQTLSPAASVDTVLWIYDSVGNFILKDDGGKGAPETLAVSLPAGTYWVQVYDYNNVYGPTATYNLRVAVYPSTTAPDTVFQAPVGAPFERPAHTKSQ